MREVGQSSGNHKTSASSPGVCGPDVTEQLIEVWTTIQKDFRRWSPENRSKACSTILIPVKKPRWEGGVMPSIRSAADINGWDVLPLFQHTSKWLRSYPVYDPDTGGPCATPSSLNPSAPDNDDAHESDQTCSNTVQVGGKCWLNGTVNYGTYGIMVRLCRDEFPYKFRFALDVAEGLIKAYKKFGAHPEDPTLPLAWLHATYHGGPRGLPSNPGNRPNCKCTCGCTGKVTTWDYVWEPVKTRDRAKKPTIQVKPASPPSPPPKQYGPPAPPPAPAKTYTVLPGDSLSKIAQKVYADSSQWKKIYNANTGVIGSNPNLIKVGQKLTIP